MKNLNPLLNRQLPKILNRILFAIFIISILGFIDAAYLTSEHFLGGTPECSFFRGCSSVTTSRYSVIFGIPIAFLGALFYATIFIIAMTYKEIRRFNTLIVLNGVTVVGFLVTLYLIYLQLFVINELCLYCIISALSSTMLFILSAVFLMITRKQDISK